MAKIETIQTSFTGGEFAPALFGRTDIAQYDNACALVENFLIRPYGSLISCPGTEFIKDAKFQDTAGIDANAVLMLHGDGDEGSVNFTDSSTYSHTVIGKAKAIHSTAQKKFGVSSILPGVRTSPTGSGVAIFPVDRSSYKRTMTVFGNSFYGLRPTDIQYKRPGVKFDGATDYIQVPHSSDFNFGTDDFAIEFFVRLTNLSTASNMALLSYVTDVNNYWALVQSGSNMVFKVVEDSSTTIEESWPLSFANNQDREIALTRSSGTLSYFVGGVTISSSVVNTTAIPVTAANFNSNVLRIGRLDGASTYNDHDGAVDEMRISRGTFRRNADYSIVQSFREFFADDEFTLFLCHFGSVGHLVIPYSTKLDLQGISCTLDWQNYFINMPTSGSENQTVIAQLPVNYGTRLWKLSFKVASGVLSLDYDASGGSVQAMTFAANTIIEKKWQHLAVTIDEGDNEVKLYVDGVSQGAYDITTSPIPAIPTNSNLVIGSNGQASDWDAYIDEFRISDTLRYTANFTPPTIPYANADDVEAAREYGKTRIIPFVFSKTDSYIIEIGATYFRFYTNGAVVTSPGTTVLEIVHTYTEDEIFEIQYAQINDVIYLTHKDHRTQKLTRIAANNWTLTDFGFVGGPFKPDNFDDAILYTPSATTGTIDITVSPTGSGIFIVSSATTLGHVNSYWKIGATITDSTTGLAVQGYVKITNVVNAYTVTASVIKNLVDTVATNNWAEGSWSAVRGYPARTTFYQQRLGFARTAHEPQNVWLSKSFIFEDFAVEGGEDDDAINIQLASNESNDIKWIVPAKALIAGTYGGEYAIETGDGSPLTPANTNVNKETSWGSEEVIPKKIGNFFYYIQRFGLKLRELLFDFDTLDGYKSLDRTILAPHIADDGFIDLAYQQNPDTILWCVTSAGNLATLTREIDQEVSGWARQTTDGRYESVAVIPSATEANDEVWVVVQRTVKGTSVRRYIERFKSQIVPDRQDKSFYVHSGLSFDAYEATDARAAGLTLSATAGTSVVLSSSTGYFESNDVGQRVRAIDADGATLGEIKITAFTSSTIAIGTVTKSFDGTSYVAGRWGVSVTTISGLDHLEDKAVTVLGDGGTDGANKTVSDGTITLKYNYFVVHVGLPYTQKITTLAQENGADRGTAQGKIQKISEVAFKVNNSYTGFLYGGATDKLDKVRFREAATLMGTPQPFFTGVLANLSFNDDYKVGSQVLIQNPDPLPIELLNIITTLDTQEKT